MARPLPIPPLPGASSPPSTVEGVGNTESDIGEVPRTDKGAGDPLKLILIVCDWLGVSALQVLSGDRHQPVSRARHWICWWLYYREGWDKQQISDVVGINYGSVTYALRRIDRLRRQEPHVYDDLSRRLR